MIYRKFFLQVLVVAIAFALIFTVNAYAAFYPLSKIISPTRFETLGDYPVGIEVTFHKKARPHTFKAWLNGKDITDKFQVSETGAVAIVGPKDGLRYREELSPPRGQAANWLKTKIKGSRRTRDVDYRLFFVILTDTENHPPVADAGPDMTAQIGDTVTMDGSGSTDVDGDQLYYTWSFSRPDGSNAQLSDPNAIRPTFDVDLRGTYTGELIVSDDEFDSEPDDVQVTTENTAPVASILVSPVGNVYIGAIVTMDGSGSTDVDNDDLTYEWTLVDTPPYSSATLEPDSVDPFKQYLTPDMPGEYLVQLVVNDGEFDSDPYLVTITTENNRPIAIIEGPDNPVNIGDPVSIDGSQSYDPDGDDIDFSWSLIGMPSESTTELNVNEDTCELTPDQAGDYVVQLIVNDDYDSSDPVTTAITALAEVPNVVELSQTQAELAIRDAGLDVGDIVSSYHSTVLYGHVFGQDPIAGETLPALSLVNLWVSLGIANVIVPDVVDQSQADAQSDMEGAGLVLGDVTEQNSDTVQAGNVISQDPAAETSVTPGTAVDLVVSLGPLQVTIPNVIDLTQSAAESAITGASLVVGSVTTVHSDTVSSGIVISQNPAEGASVDAGSSVDLVVSLGPETVIPPDPADVAPEIDPTVPTSIYTATEFLYSGANPIQTGVPQGTIDPRRGAIVRGLVISRDGVPLPGVTIRIDGHSDYGQTLSRNDGMFDLAVNGGGSLTVAYTKEGYLPAHRSIDVPWRDFVHVPDVVLIARDTQVTAVDLSIANTEPVQMARGSVATDDDGARQATLFFFQGTTAQMIMPDGSSQGLDALNVRATEYTVGSNGPAAMPAQLPPTSGYTYAVELSVDQAVAVGARQVTFNQPVSYYVENFINMPIGTKVPAAYYDPDKTAWVPTADGMVIKLVSVTDTLADVDATGDGQADNSLGLTDAERLQLAATYTVDQELWRVRLDHFSSVDLNYGIAPRREAERPSNREPTGGRDTVEDVPNKQKGFGSADVENQVFTERYNVVGSPFSLNYQSDENPGYQFGNTIQIELTGSDLPLDIFRVDLTVFIAGRRIRQEYDPTANLSVDFTWDGKDVYGRTLVGEQPARVKIEYVYPVYYLLPAGEDNSFGLPSGTLIPSNIPARNMVTSLYQEFSVTLGRRPARNIGGWGIGAHHIYDPAGKTLYTGTGGRKSAKRTNVDSLHRLAGSDESSGYSGDGGPAKDALLYFPGGVAVADDGSIYVADELNHCIRKISSEGVITTVAGTGTQGFSGDGGPAIAAQLNHPRDVDVGPDGSLYIADTANDRIRRMTTDGIITTVAGNGISGFGGDNGPAVSAQLDEPVAVAVFLDGTFFIADYNNNRIRRVGPGGLITTYAGNGSQGYAGDGSPATEAEIGNPRDVDVGLDGSVYIADLYSNTVRRINPAGIISTVAGVYDGGGYSIQTLPAGTGNEQLAMGKRAVRSMLSQLAPLVTPPNAWAAAGIGGGDPNDNDGILAIDAVLMNLTSIAVRNDGTLLIADWDRIYNVDATGMLTLVAGGGQELVFSEGLPGKLFGGMDNHGLALHPDGRIVVASNNILLAIAGGFPEYDGEDKLIPSSTGTMVYRFNASGRHLETLHALTGESLLSFAYDAAGQLTSITDADANVTTIDRDSNGNPTSIIGPFGQTTAIGLNADGYIESLTNPAGETVTMEYLPEGLLTSVKGPRDNTYRFDYDSAGLLIAMHDPLNATDTLSRAVLDSGHEVSLTSAEERTTTYRIENTPSGSRNRTVVTPDGLATETIIGTDGSHKTTLPDGTIIEGVQGPDPRFGMLVPILAEQKRTTPDGIETSKTMERTVVLSEPDDILSVVSITDTLSFNGKTFTTVYDGATGSFTSTSPEGRTSTRQIDTKGRTTARQTEDLAATTYSYNARGQLTLAERGIGTESRSNHYGYDTSGRISTTADAENRSLSFQYDAANRVIDLELPGSLFLTYAYDASGNRTAVIPPGGEAHTFDHNSLDYLASYTAPDVGLPSEQTAYAYNDDRQLTTVTRPDGLVITNSYDSSGRLATVTALIDTISWSFDTFGHLQTVASIVGGNVNYGYDGSLLTSQSWEGPVSGTVSFEHNSNLQITSVAVNNVVASYSYDDDGWLMSAGNLSVARTNSANHLVSGTVLAGVSHTFDYNEFGEWTTLHADYDGTGIYDCQYTRDKLGRITQKVETIGGTSWTYDYTYDAAGRLSRVDEDGSLVENFAYDGNGNRLASGSVTATYDAQNRLTQYGTKTYEYSDNGELIRVTDGSEITTYNYDVFGNLLEVSLPGSPLIEYVADGNGRRIVNKKGGNVVSKFLYADQLNPIAELDADDNLVSRFVYAVRSNTPDYMINGGNVYRLVCDHLGSVRLVVNTSDGTIAQRMDYDSFGNVLSDTSPGFQPFGYAGGLYDPDTKLVRFGARDYDPQTGRWTTKDPLRFVGSSLNFYAYVGNDPVNLIDPLGLGPMENSESSGEGTPPPEPEGVGSGSISEDDHKEKLATEFFDQMKTMLNNPQTKADLAQIKVLAKTTWKLAMQLKKRGYSNKDVMLVIGGGLLSGAVIAHQQMQLESMIGTVNKIISNSKGTYTSEEAYQQQVNTQDIQMMFQ